MELQPKHTIIIGSGFAGIRTALDLSRVPLMQVTLVTNQSDFEYYPGLHKIISHSEHATYTIPLEKIFQGTSVQIIVDPVTDIDIHTKTVCTVSGKQLTGDYLVLAMGSQTEYFNIDGLQDTAFGFKSVADAKKLRSHIEQLFSKHHKADKAETVVALHMVIVGGGPNGVDLAAELATFSKQLAQEHGILESFITINLIEGASRILPMMPERVSVRVTDRLEKLGVNVLCNRDLQKNDSWTVTLADMTLGARTLIWTAGITTNELVKKIKDLELGKKSRIIVDEFLQAKGFEHVFCIGDNADTPYSGLAQTAIHNGQYVAGIIERKHFGKTFHSYIPKSVAYNIGVGHRWSVLVIGSFISFGFFPYVMRTIIDIKFFLSILPVREVWKLYFAKKTTS
jgi:NADH dehydrogenase